MLGSATLDMAIGMAFIFMLMSLVVSAIREAIEARLQDRAKLLALGLNELLGGIGPDPGNPEGKRLLKELYTHPLVEALYSGPFEEGILDYRRNKGGFWILKYLGSFFSKRTRMPAYIPAKTIALALLDLARNHQLVPGIASPAAGAPGPLDLGEVRRALESQKDSRVACALLAVLSQAGQDGEKGVKAIQDWYDGSMDRVSGWFKRETQQILFTLGLVAAVILNVDAIFMVKYLAANEQTRSSLASVATTKASQEMTKAIDELRKPQPKPGQEAGEAAAASGTPVDYEASLRAADVKVSNAIRVVTDLNLPLGWNHTRWNDFRVFDGRTAWTIVGWLVTAFALSFGAPFWFDVLNKLMVIRSTVKPHEKSPEEASEDRQKK